MNNMDPKALTLKFVDYFNKKEASSIGTLLADNFALFDPKLKWVRGKQAVVDVLDKGFKDTQNVQYKVINLYQEGNITILEFKITMDDAHFDGVDLIEWKEDKMVELRCYYNPPEEGQ